VRRSALTLVAAAMLIAGCGGGDSGNGSDGGTAAGKYDDQDVANLFRQAGGVELVTRSSTSFDTLTLPEESGAEANAQDRYGAFNIYVVKRKDALQVFRQDDKKREIKPENGIYWERSTSGSGWTATRFYDNVVLTWIADDKKTDARYDRLTTILANLGKPANEIKLPPEDTPCAKQHIDPVGPGKEGTCKLDEKTLTIVDRDGTLKLAAATASDVELKIGKELVSRRFGLVERHRPRDGSFVLVKYKLKNTGKDPLDSFDAGLAVGDRLFAEDERTEFEVQPSEDPFPLQPGSSAEIVAPFDVAPSVAKQVKKIGALELSGDPDPSSLDLSSSIGRIRLSGPTGA
jgi:hypothetical protein